MKDNTLNILIAGEAGQGLATVGPALSRSLVRAGYYLHVSQTYESRVRGGHNTFAIRTHHQPCPAPGSQVDILVAFNQHTIELHASQLTPKGFIISDDKLAAHSQRHIRVPVASLGKNLHLNTIMLAAVGALLGLREDNLAASLQLEFEKLSQQVLEENLVSLHNAFQWTIEQKLEFEILAKAPFPANHNLMLDGNQGIALGAMAAGLKFCSFYPMSPGTSISLNIADAAPKLGIVVEQAEDELAAINMAIGASYAGARAMVASSGGGFALMCEGISLAGMVETPLVVAIAMRPGPATGLPTRTEQADLNLALYAGHGEFPRAIFAPANPAQCVELTMHAFDLAEKYQSPIFVLTDQYLTDCFSNVAPFTFKQPVPLAQKIASQDDNPDYQRFALTSSGVSPRVLPGLGKTLAISDSDEHDLNGYLTEDLLLRVKMQDKRMRKLNGLLEDFLPPVFSGAQQPELLLCCWGSSLGAVQEASRLLGEDKVGVCHFPQVYPLDPAAFLPKLQAAKKVVMVESNYSGQMARLLYAESGFKVHGHVLRYDGLALSAQYIMQHLN